MGVCLYSILLCETVTSGARQSAQPLWNCYHWSKAVRTAAKFD